MQVDLMFRQPRDLKFTFCQSRNAFEIFLIFRYGRSFKSHKTFLVQNWLMVKSQNFFLRDVLMQVDLIFRQPRDLKLTFFQ
jgi:hypothetical protein